MPPLPKPRFDFEYDPAEEIGAPRRYFASSSREYPGGQHLRGTHY
jgi:hypothetical protein